MKLIRKRVVICIVCLCFIASSIPHIASQRSDGETYFDEDMAVICFGEKQDMQNCEKIEISLSKAIQIKTKLLELKQSADKGDIDGVQLIEYMLKIFREEKILPDEYTIDNITKTSLLIFDEIIKNSNLKNAMQKYSFHSDLMTEKANNPDIGDSPNLQLGLITLKGSFAFGGPFGWGIPITPFESMQEQLIDPIEFEFPGDFPDTTLKFYWTISPNVIFFTPGSPLGAHGIASLIPFPGWNDYKQVLWSGESCLGIGVGLISPVTIVAYINGDISQSTIFEATIQVIGGGAFLKYDSASYS